jgi:hypothetical protein
MRPHVPCQRCGAPKRPIVDCPACGTRADAGADMRAWRDAIRELHEPALAGPAPAPAARLIAVDAPRWAVDSGRRVIVTFTERAAASDHAVIAIPLPEADADDPLSFDWGGRRRLWRRAA